MYKINEINKATKGKILFNNKKIIRNISINSKDILNDTLFIAIKGENKDGHDYISDAINNGVEAIIIDKNYINKNDLIKECTIKKITLIEVNDTLVALQNLANYNRIKNKNTKIIAITGSNGKTSVKELLYDILKDKYKVLKTEGNLNNHIGLPLTLLKLNNEDICILEMGMNHSGEIETLSKIANPDIAIITNIGTAHIGYLKTKENILKAKMEITLGLKENGILLLNGSDEMLNTVPLNNSYTIMRYNFDDRIKIIRDNKYIMINKKLINLNKVGEKYPINIVLAYYISNLFDIKFKDFKKSCYNHKMPSLRMEEIKIKNNIIINDCYNANYDSMKNGIEYVVKKYQKKYRILLYLGDMLELGEWSNYYHSKIGELINNSNIDILYVTGNEIKETYDKVNDNIIKREFKKDDDINYITDKILEDLDSVSNNVIYFKASRRINLDNISRELIKKLKHRS